MQVGIYSSQWPTATSRDQSKETYKKALRLQILFADIELFFTQESSLAFRP